MIWVGDITEPIGYSEAGRNYLCALAAVGYEDAALHPTAAVRWNTLSSYHALLEHYRGRDHSSVDQRVRLCHRDPLSVHELSVRGLYNVALTTWETDRLSPGAKFNLNANFRRVWVPSTFNRESFRASGVKLDIPINVVPHAVTRFGRPAGVERPDALQGRYVFISVGSRNARKNPQAALRAYLKAFDADDPVAFVYKVWSPLQWDSEGRRVKAESAREEVARLQRECGKKRPAYVVAVDRVLSRDDMTTLVAHADCFVSSHRGEGFGLAILEAKAMGLRVVATGWSGPVDYLDPDVDVLVPYALTKAVGLENVRPGFAPNQSWAEPDGDAFVDALKQAARERTPGDYSKIEKTHNLAAVGRQMATILDECRAQADARKIVVGLPERRPPVVFVSTWNQKCGISQYAEQLYARLHWRACPVVGVLGEAGASERLGPSELPAYPRYERVWRRGSAKEVTAWLDAHPARGGIVHVQHEFGFWRDALALGPLLEGARERGWRTIVTMHTILPPGLAEESLFKAACKADALIALGEPGAVALEEWVRLTNGRARVYRVPQGCPYVVDEVDGPGGSRALPLKERCRARMGVGAETLCLHVGYLVQQKRLYEVLEAVIMNAEALRAAKFLLLIAGGLREGADRKAEEHVEGVKAVVEEAGISDLVRAHAEFVPDADMPVLLHAADFAVLNHDGVVLSNSATLRGLQAYGVPVCAADVPMLSDAMAPVGMAPGALTHSDHEQLGANLVRLATDAALRASLREGQLEIAARNSWDAVSLAHMRIYAEVADGQGR